MQCRNVMTLCVRGAVPFTREKRYTTLSIALTSHNRNFGKMLHQTKRVEIVWKDEGRLRIPGIQLNVPVPMRCHNAMPLCVRGATPLTREKMRHDAVDSTHLAQQKLWYNGSPNKESGSV